MSLSLVVFSAAALLLAAYFSYGNFLSRLFGLRKNAVTPANKFNDGEDYVPADRNYLLGQHFSAIAAAGPIVGPILAGLWFGWAPALIWILLGAVFVGGVHDFSSLVVSVRHQGKSIAEVVRQNMSRRAYLLFLGFIWLTLVYVIIAFTDVTAATFAGGEEGNGVASASMLYLLLAVALGLFIRATGMREGRATLLFLPLVVASVWLGGRFPLTFSDGPHLSAVLKWDYLLLGYCFIASLTPVWALLQPRGALGGYFLYATLLVGVAGLLLGGAEIQWPAFQGWGSADKPMIPLLFVTVACGACSGFHSIVSSGTTSKQLKRETDAQAVGYGAMLLEGFVALIALATVMMLAPGSEEAKKSPNMIYASGIGGFLTHFGVDRQQAVAFGLLAFATFVYDTLDVCTRLGRYIFLELFSLRGRKGEVVATAATLLLPAYCVSLKVHDAAGNLVPVWRVFWTLFGASNQLLAALTLLGVTVWMKREGKPLWVTLVPMAFMMAMTLWTLVLLARPLVYQLLGRAASIQPAEGLAALVLITLALFVLVEALQVLAKPAVARSR